MPSRLIYVLAALLVPWPVFAQAPVLEQGVNVSVDTCRRGGPLVCVRIQLGAVDGQPVQVAYAVTGRTNPEGSPTAVIVPALTGTTPTGSLVLDNGTVRFVGAGLDLTLTPDGRTEQIRTGDTVSVGPLAGQPGDAFGGAPGRVFSIVQEESGRASGTVQGFAFATGGEPFIATILERFVQVTTTPTTPTYLTSGPDRVRPGARVLVAWAGIADANPRDWIGLYRPFADDLALIDWVYVDCTQVGSERAIGGACEFTIPAGIVPWVYEFRLYADDGFTQRLATSRPFVVVP